MPAAFGLAQEEASRRLEIIHQGRRSALSPTHHRSIMSYTSIDRMSQPSESDGPHPENCRWDGVPRLVPDAAHPERHPFRL